MDSTTELRVFPRETSWFDLKDISSFNRWLRKQPFKQRVVCAGNHDRYFENMPEIARGLLTDAVYLENDGITIDGVSFWGSPYTPEFLNWAFMYPRGGAAKRYWDQIPFELDVLITHRPPRGILDQIAPGGYHLGCEALLKAVEAKKPEGFTSSVIPWRRRILEGATTGVCERLHTSTRAV